LFITTHCCADIFIFGDSLSDTGNTYEATTSLFFVPDIPHPDQGYWQGRFSNGPVWVEYVAVSLGESIPVPSRLGGNNFSHGGSNVLESGFLQPSLAEQVAEVSSVEPSDWCVIWAGSTDMLGADLSNLNGAMQTAQSVATEIENNINDLYSIGARRLIVLNIPALGRVPLSAARLTSQERMDLNDVCDFLNIALSESLDSARQNNPGLQILEFDAYGLFEEAVADPGEFGLTNVTDAAAPFDPFDLFFAGLATDPPPKGTNVNEYLFYDGLHPTAVAHLLVGDQVSDALSGTVDIAVEQFNIFRGTLLEGGLSDLLESDDSWLSVNPGITLSPSEPPVWLEFHAVMTPPDPSSLQFSIESSANTFGLTQTIELFNWTAGQYQQVNSKAASFNNDFTVQIDLTDNVGHFVQSGTGLIKARVGWRATGPISIYPWTIRIDRVFWTLAP
jgi:phospholipase/lecithinase/hemolysin